MILGGTSKAGRASTGLRRDGGTGSGAVKVAGYLPWRQNGLNLRLSRFSPTHSVFSFRIFFCLLLLPVVPTAEARIGLALPYDPPEGYCAAADALLGEGLRSAWQGRDHSPGDFAEASRRRASRKFPSPLPRDWSSNAESGGFSSEATSQEDFLRWKNQFMALD